MRTSSDIVVHDRRGINGLFNDVAGCYVFSPKYVSS